MIAAAAAQAAAAQNPAYSPLPARLFHTGMPEITIAPALSLSGAVQPPGDKSISHRCAMLAAVATGGSKLSHYSSGADCQSTLACLRALGVEITVADGTVAITGVGLHGLRAPQAALDAGNSGTTLRLLSGILAAQTFASEIGGDSSLNRRPMRRILEPLGRMGARIAAAAGDTPPLRFTPAAAGLQGIAYAPPVASAQVKSALLLAGLYAHGVTRVSEALATRDHTELLLHHMGAPLEKPGRGEMLLKGPVELLRALEDYRVPGDPSAAAFFLCAAAAMPDSDLTVEEVSLNPQRSALLDVLARLGARAQILGLEERAGELAGSLWLVAPAQGLAGTTIAGAEAVALIDEAPILAMLATRTREGIEFRDMAELRVKESDRIAAIAANLRAMGGMCEERPDGMFVPGGQTLHGARITTHGDHRIAMAFAIAALWAEGASTIEDAECAAISYPAFYADLARLAQR